MVGALANTAIATDSAIAIAAVAIAVAVATSSCTVAMCGAAILAHGARTTCLHLRG